jgi:hypothetical protein
MSGLQIIGADDAPMCEDGFCVIPEHVAPGGSHGEVEQPDRDVTTSR